MKTKTLIAYESPSIEAADSMKPEGLLCISFPGNKLEGYTNEDDFEW